MAEAAQAAPREVLDAKDQDFKVVPLEKLQESKSNPRKTFEPKAMEDLVRSVGEKGVIVPLVCRPVDGHLEIVAGARRFRAAKKAGLKELPVLIRKLTDDQALEVMVIENLQRADVHPLEEAEGYRQLMARGKYDIGAIAEKVGKSVSYVYQRLKLAELSEPARKAFLEETITAGHAILIARLTPDEQKAALDRCIPKVDTSGLDPGDWNYEPREEKLLLPVRRLAQWIADEIHTDLARMPWDMADAGLLPTAGACATCPKRTGNQPALFPEVQKDSVCTDRACFKEKFNAWIDRKLKELKAQGKKAVVISEEEHNWRLGAHPDREGVKRAGEWHAPGKKKCRSLGLGIWFDGKSRGQLAEVCTAASCSVHNPRPTYSGFSGSSSKPKTPEEAAREKRRQEARILKEKRKGEIQVALLFAALEKAPPKLEIRDLRDMAVQVMQSGELQLLERLFPWLDKGYDTCVKEIGKLKERDLLKLIRAPRFIRWGERVDEKPLAEACRVWKVPAGKIRTDLEKKWAQEDAALKKSEKATAAAGARRRRGEELPDLHVGQPFLGVEHEVLEGLAVASIKKARSKKLPEPTCGRCGCTEDDACEGATGDGCSWVVLDRGTNHGLCSACVKPGELGKINPAIEAALGGHGRPGR